MPKTAFQIEFEVFIKSIHSPGTHLYHFEDVYIELQIFGVSQKSALVPSRFPIIFNERFQFSYILWTSKCRDFLLHFLKETSLSVELRQTSCCPAGNILLSVANIPGHQILVKPFTYQNLEIKMSKSNCFPGLSPQIKFKSYVKIFQSNTPIMDFLIDRYHSTSHEATTQRIERFEEKIKDIPSCHFCHYHRPCNHCPEKKPTSCYHVEADAVSYCHENCKECIQKLAICSYCKWKLNIVRQRQEQQEFNEALRERLNKSSSNLQKFNGAIQLELRPPFLVSKVKNSSIERHPDDFENSFSNSIKKLEKQKKKSESECHHRAVTASPHRYRAPWVRVPHPCAKSRIRCDSCEMMYKCRRSGHATTNAEAIKLDSHGCVSQEIITRRSLRKANTKPVYGYLKKSNSSRTLLSQFEYDNAVDNDDNREQRDLMKSTRPISQMKGYEDLRKYLTERKQNSPIHCTLCTMGQF